MGSTPRRDLDRRKLIQRTQELMKRIPGDALRVRVEDATGRCHWRPVDKILPDDEIMTDQNGDPIVSKKKMGRPEKPKILPVDAVVQELIKQKDTSIHGDELVTSVREKNSQNDIYQNILQGLAEESASLEFERKEAERKGQPTVNISSKRAVVLRAMADLTLRRQDQLRNRTIDLKGELFQRLFAFIMETFRGSLEDTNLRPEEIERAFQNLSRRIADEGWENEAAKRMAGKQ